MRKAWNHLSEVTACTQCEGHGAIASHHQPSTWDPYPSEPCDACDGEPHDPECEVCGFDQVVPGYNCLVCDTIASMFPADLAKLDVAKFAAAMAVARDAALADVREAA